MAAPGLTRKEGQRPCPQEPSAAGWALEQPGAGHTQDQLSALVAPQPGGSNHGCILGHCVSMRGSLTAELTLWHQHSVLVRETLPEACLLPRIFSVHLLSPRVGAQSIISLSKFTS